ncbi:sensor histidine kinase [Rhodocista pekingensis]|uniref:histidine kinase n=1 Tax=Rhodocista pekingensis TaxID=201185 RepID=A0ABW2KTA4_9PROT
MDLFRLLFDPAPFMPHGMCLLWHPALIWTHLVSDLLTAAAYFTIPAALVYFVRRRTDIVFGWIFVLFSLFIFACGTTHLFGAITLWYPSYVLEGAVKAVTALASVATAIVIWPLLPRALALPSPAQLRLINTALSAEVGERMRAERAVREANTRLEERVAARTAELAAANEALREANETLERRVAERTAELEAVVRALRESEARYAGIVQHAADAIFVVDVGSDGSFRYAAVNPALVRETGLTEAVLIGRTPEEALGGSYGAEVRGWFTTCVETRAPQQVEHVVERNGSRTVWLTALVPVFDPENGRVIQLVGTARNLTEYRQLQEELAQAAKLATLGTMAAGVAHEVSQPLNAIRITATDCALLLDEEGPPDLDYVRSGLATIRDQSARMGGIVDQMRQFGRRAPERPQRFDPAEPVRRAAGLLERHFASADIALCLEIEEPLPAVTGHAVKLEQVVLNLLTNARDAIEEARAHPPADSADGPPPGRIGLHAAAAPGRAAVTISVEDDGAGLPAGMADRIFDPFFTTKASEKGMGLGLSICASIVAAMGGRIEAVPLPRGTRFVVTLPVPAALESAA